MWYLMALYGRIRIVEGASLAIYHSRDQGFHPFKNCWALFNRSVSQNGRRGRLYLVPCWVRGLVDSEAGL